MQKNRVAHDSVRNLCAHFRRQRRQGRGVNRELGDCRRRFQPPLVVVGVKADSGAHAIIKDSKVFALNILGKDQKGQAFTFFKPLEREGNTIGGEPFRKGSLGAPILEKAPAYVECQLVDTIEKGDHSIFVGEVKDAGVATQPSGRPDDAILAMRDLGR